MSDVEREEVHRTTWTGTIADSMLRDIVYHAICNAAGVNWWEKGLTFTLTTVSDAKIQRFVLTKDELWHQKQEAA